MCKVTHIGTQQVTPCISRPTPVAAPDPPVIASEGRLASEGAAVEAPAPGATEGPEMVSVYVPTTPNPTSGFFLMVRKDETIELDMSVDEALKYVVSMEAIGIYLEVVRTTA